ncbi:SDR family NAD(P)-dependent oxidoreductase [Saccharomonospora glauca]|uniref:Short-chain alcohol dehydrogenase like protein n=1 Tax=Saccharomonospora glauca K62 TaxID=928724 RepID=I1D3E2_9PSEU|nr:glucose 1-dehydrogenase [Saccharomonospora glauca]EIE99466.1 dehydrogenase of unknown specificity [Saccharomonospora glauca K62]
MNEWGLQGRSVIVTGAGSGIGRATARRFAVLGARVLVNDLHEKAAADTVDELVDTGAEAVAVAGDVSSRNVVTELARTAVDRFGAIDVLVNNAGVTDNFSAVADVTDDEWERLLRINLTAPFLMAREVLPYMLKAGRGAIVNVTSQAGLRGSAAGAAYTASKHGLVGLTKSLAVTYRDKGIRCNAVAPGGTATSISVQPDPKALGPTAIMRHLGNMGRIAEASEQAAVITFLASDLASDVNGVVLPVDDGWSAV